MAHDDMDVIPLDDEPENANWLKEFRDKRFRYTVEDPHGVETVYEGFSTYQSNAEMLALVTIDGEPTLYSSGFDTDLARSELTRKYQNDYGREPERIEFFVRK